MGALKNLEFGTHCSASTHILFSVSASSLLCPQRMCCVGLVLPECCFCPYLGAVMLEGQHIFLLWPIVPGEHLWAFWGGPFVRDGLTLGIVVSFLA